MNLIKYFNISRCRNKEHAQFHDLVKADIDKEDMTKLGITKVYPAYTSALAEEHKAIEVEQGSRYTSAIEEADKYRDELYRAFTDDVKSKQKWFDEAVREAAKRIKRIIKQAGYVPSSTYADETEAVSSLTNQLKTNYAADLALCTETELVDKLDEANVDFENRFGSRTDEAAIRTSGDVRKARLATNKAYENLMTAINGLALSGDETVYAALIGKINALVDYYKNMLALRKGRADAPDIPPPPEK
ncbi:DUF6261 family protein [Limibacterium fermenti]|uniref:DUF6261 family protein n=1 Tax=Limibacterium fermenti TaxID=3229863 RepID=UPI000E8C41C5|nr:hypothetical protein [Porphyromonadaceae bacterium]HBX46211.1 hypothetical protein [Porphyromonadaceae bacterium]